VRIKLLGSLRTGLPASRREAFEQMVRVVEALAGTEAAVEQRRKDYPAGAERGPTPFLMLGGESGGGTISTLYQEQCWLTVDLAH